MIYEYRKLRNDCVKLENDEFVKVFETQFMK